jgi:hypothetical protein
MFTSVVQRILKHNGDFGKYPQMRRFVQDYLMALVSQNAGMQTVMNFVASMHRHSIQCPFPRVLPNFSAVCLAGIHGCFEQRRKPNVQAIVQLSEEEKEEQLICYTTMMKAMSQFDDWRVHLAQLMQSVPFPDQAFTNEKFLPCVHFEFFFQFLKQICLSSFIFRIFKSVIESFTEDTRCEVHQTLLGIREGKEGWLELFCPGGLACNDEGELFSRMVNFSFLSNKSLKKFGNFGCGIFAVSIESGNFAG